MNRDFSSNFPSSFSVISTVNPNLIPEKTELVVESSPIEEEEDDETVALVRLSALNKLHTNISGERTIFAGAVISPRKHNLAESRRILTLKGCF